MNTNALCRMASCDGTSGPIEPFSMTKGTTKYYLTYDQVGSLRTVTNTSGAVVKQINYDSFGNIITDTDPTFKVPFTFAGGLNDQDTNLIRFGYRDYAPEVGRWTAKDPIGFAGGDADLYGYCINDPINWIDPNGLAPFSPSSPVHTHRNINNKCPQNPPKKSSDSNNGQNFCSIGDGEYKDHEGYSWDKDNPITSRMYHGGDKGYTTFRGKGNYSGSQCVYDENDNLVDSGPYMGTYDYRKAGTTGHYDWDVKPHNINPNYEPNLTITY